MKLVFIFIFFRLYHQNSLGSLKLLRDNQPNTSLPPLPYNQDKQHTTRLIHDVPPKSSKRPENVKSSDLDSRRSKEPTRQTDASRNEWRRTSNNNLEETRRRAGRQQPSPRNSRNHYNVGRKGSFLFIFWFWFFLLLFVVCLLLLFVLILFAFWAWTERRADLPKQVFCQLRSCFIPNLQ